MDAIEILDAAVEATDAADGLLVLPSSAGISISEAARKIFARIAPRRELFRRGGLVQTLLESETGKYQLEVMRDDAFRSRLENFGTLMVYRADREGKTKLIHTICPADTAKALLACDEVRVLPPVRGLVSAPVIAQVDGVAEVLGKGYHEVSGGLLVTGGETPPDVPLHDAVEAVKLLVADFDFQTPGDRSRALASFITPALRLGGWLTEAVPADVAEADQSQSGKTYRQKLIFALYREEPTRIARKDGGVGGLDESVQAAMIAGSPFVQIDNLRGKLDSQYMEMAMTAGGQVGCRVPHRGEVQVDARHFMFYLTSNGVETTPDLANRSSIVRIRKRPGCEYKAFPEGDLLAHVQARQPYYLGAVFAVVRAWAAQGCQRSRENRHDFRQWGGVLDWIVTNMLGEAPLMDGHVEAQSRVSNPALSWLRQVAIAIAADNRLGVELTASDLAELCMERDLPIPGSLQEDEKSRRKQIGGVMKRAFGDLEEVHVDGFTVARKLVMLPDDENRAREVKVYTVSRT